MSKYEMTEIEIERSWIPKAMIILGISYILLGIITFVPFHWSMTLSRSKHFICTEKEFKETYEKVEDE